jgi:hypothetical protein
MIIVKDEINRNIAGPTHTNYFAKLFHGKPLQTSWKGHADWDISLGNK